MDIADELWDEHLIFPKSKYFSDPCRYIDIFCGVWAAAYYSHIWSDMVVADILQTFDEEKDDAAVGSRFVQLFPQFFILHFWHVFVLHMWHSLEKGTLCRSGHFGVKRPIMK